MSLDHYHALQRSGDPGARQYLEAHFDQLFPQAIERFASVGWSAIGMSLAAALIAFGCWLRLRHRLPLPWLWLLPLLVLAPYAFIKGAVVYQLIQQAPELPQMWGLYFKQWTPLKMVRTPTLGLLLTTGAMGAAVLYRARRRIQ